MTWSLKPEHCRAARNLLGWTAADLARASEVSEATIHYFEQGQRKLQRRTERDLVGALEGAGIDWSSEAPGEPHHKCADGTVITLRSRGGLR